MNIYLVGVEELFQLKAVGRHCRGTHSGCHRSCISVLDAGKCRATDAWEQASLSISNNNRAWPGGTHL